MGYKFLIILGIIYLTSCTSKKQPNNQFLISPNQNNILQGRQGSILIVPKDCFVDENGIPVKENINLKLIEVFSLSSIIENGLETVTDERLLVTGGMIYLEATIESRKKVQVDKSKSIRLIVQNKRVVDTNIYQFYEQENGLWGNPKSSSPYLIHIPFEELNLKIVKTEGNRLPADILLYDYLKKDIANTNLIALIDKTYFSSKEFEERFTALLNPNISLFDGEGGIENSKGKEMLSKYIENIDKPLWFADSIVLGDLQKIQENRRNNRKSSSYRPPISDEEQFSDKEFDMLTYLFEQFKNQGKTILDPIISLTKEDLKNLQVYYNKIKDESKVISSFDVQNLGWHNIDFLYEKDSLELAELVVGTNVDLEKIALILKEGKVVVQGKRKEVKSFIFSRKLPQVSAYLIGIGMLDGTLYFCKKEIQIGQNEVEELELKPSSQEEISKVLEEIDKGYQ
jgi:hypothetical protein